MVKKEAWSEEKKKWNPWNEKKDVKSRVKNLGNSREGEKTARPRWSGLLSGKWKGGEREGAIRIRDSTIAKSREVRGSYGDARSPDNIDWLGNEFGEGKSHEKVKTI